LLQRLYFSSLKGHSTWWNSQIEFNNKLSSLTSFSWSLRRYPLPWSFLYRRPCLI
jgi:hypothetical protein